MRKVLILLGIFLLTGCGNTLTCKTGKSDVSEVYKIEYSGNDITGISVKKIYKFDNKNDFKSFEGIIQYNVKADSVNKVKSSYKKKRKKYILKQVFNIDNLSDEDLTRYGLSKNKDTLIDKFRSNGLTCK